MHVLAILHDSQATVHVQVAEPSKDAEQDQAPCCPTSAKGGKQ